MEPRSLLHSDTQRNFKLRVEKTDEGLKLDVQDLSSLDCYAKVVNKDSITNLTDEIIFSLDTIFLILQNPENCKTENSNLSLTEDGKLIYTCELKIAKITSKSGFSIDLDKQETDSNINPSFLSLKELSYKVLELEEKLKKKNITEEKENTKTPDPRYDALEKTFFEKLKEIEVQRQIEFQEWTRVSNEKLENFKSEVKFNIEKNFNALTNRLEEANKLNDQKIEIVATSMLHKIVELETSIKVLQQRLEALQLNTGSKHVDALEQPITNSQNQQLQNFEEVKKCPEMFSNELAENIEYPDFHFARTPSHFIFQDNFRTAKYNKTLSKRTCEGVIFADQTLPLNKISRFGFSIENPITEIMLGICRQGVNLTEDCVKQLVYVTCSRKCKFAIFEVNLEKGKVKVEIYPTENKPSKLNQYQEFDMNSLDPSCSWKSAPLIPFMMTLGNDDGGSFLSRSDILESLKLYFGLGD